MPQGRILIGAFDPVAEMTGGRAYREAVFAALRKKYDLEVFAAFPGDRGIIPSARLRRILAIVRVKKSKNLWVRDFYPIVALSLRRNSGKNIGLFLHMQTEGEEFDLLGRAMQCLFLRNIRKCDCVVSIAGYWRDHLHGLGIRNVRVIRSGMDLSLFQFEGGEVEAFCRKHGLTGAPIVYVGNCRRSKGVIEVYEALKEKGYHLVTSGEPDVELPCPNFRLSYHEYLLLLKASSVVITMSKFREGWCRTAHEAMLCRTPVIGSGAGGMAELLEGGKQLVCRDIRELPRMVQMAITQKERLGEEGHKFASTLTIERFKSEWLALIEELVRDSALPA
ncbi:MAG: hypothetical protein HY801_11285 [Candidatus Lindowbacteria bacterium]|nr:hypothetical protein [Candidatus Lindowbacteria bacterium]